MSLFRHFLLAFLLVSPLPALAAETDDAPPPAATEPDRQARLEQLFQTLKTTHDKAVGKAAEGEVIQLWLESGSDTVDLLMSWVLRAIEEKDYPMALDLLDRITAMKPDYAEGWNKRATVYFLSDDYAKAVSDIQRTLVLEPRHFGALSGLGTIMRALGDNNGAMAAYRQALDADPFLDKVRDSLKEIEKEAARDI